MDTYVIPHKTNYGFLIGLHTELVGNLGEKPQEWVWGIHIRRWQNMLWHIQRQPLRPYSRQEHWSTSERGAPCSLYTF